MKLHLPGRPKGFKVPNYKVYRYEHAEGLDVDFEVETRLIKLIICPCQGVHNDRWPNASVIYECVKCCKLRVMMITVIFAFSLLFMISVLVMMFITYWRVFALIQMLADRLE